MKAQVDKRIKVKKSRCKKLPSKQSQYKHKKYDIHEKASSGQTERGTSIMMNC